MPDQPTVLGTDLDWRSRGTGGGARRRLAAIWLTAALLLPALLIWLSNAALSASQLMLLHIGLMTVVAPMLAVVLMIALPRRHFAVGHSTRLFWAATVLQLLVFLYWHSPGGMHLGMHSAWGSALLQGSLLAVAVAFWWLMQRLPFQQRWQAALALLLTGKVFCLIALLMTFAPRPLYPAMSLADQQLAGLIMITICPLCYVTTGLWLFWRWLSDLEAGTSNASGAVM